MKIMKGIKTMIKKTERGWCGHFILSNRCLFRRNTLIEKDNVKIIVSTVGAMQDRQETNFEQIGYQRYYETMVFHAKFDDPYWDADVKRKVPFESPGSISETCKDNEANDMHEKVVEEIIDKLNQRLITSDNQRIQRTSR